jgi:hypothetical protein
MAWLAGQNWWVRPLARRKAERRNSSSALTARGRTHPPKRHPVPGSRPLTTKIHTTKTLQVLGIKTPRVQLNSMTGVASQRSQGGPLARRREAERRHSFRLDCKRAHAAAKGGGVAPGSTPSTRTTHMTMTMMTSQASGINRQGGAQTTWPIGPATGARRQGPKRFSPGVGAGLLSGC